MWYCLGLFLKQCLRNASRPAVLYRETKTSVSRRMRVCRMSLTTPVFAVSSEIWRGLTIITNSLQCTPESQRRVWRNSTAAMNSRERKGSPPVDSYQWNGSFLQRMQCELVIWRRRRKITSELIKTGSAEIPLARFYTWLAGTIKAWAVFNSPLRGWRHIVPILN